MPGTVLSTLPSLSHWIEKLGVGWRYYLSTVAVLRRKLRHREVDWLAQGHPDGSEWNWDLNPGLPRSPTMTLVTKLQVPPKQSAAQGLRLKYHRSLPASFPSPGSNVLEEHVFVVAGALDAKCPQRVGKVGAALSGTASGKNCLLPQESSLPPQRGRS